MPARPHIDFEALDVVKSIGPITLGEMDSIKLLNRIDTKYLTNEKVLVQVLEDALKHGYRILVAEGLRVSPYNSLYYDTPALKMFMDHHNRHLVRQKVRTRVYVSSGETFLEIKRKNNHGRTKKKRIVIAPELFQDFRADETAALYLAGHSWFTAGELLPQMETIFNRITLVNSAKTERLTIDSRLRFVNHTSGIDADLGDAVIIELKQDGRAPSEMKKILLDHRVKPIRVSKYCIGTTLTRPDVKSGRFKVKVRRIEKTLGYKISDI